MTVPSRRTYFEDSRGNNPDAMFRRRADPILILPQRAATLYYTSNYLPFSRKSLSGLGIRNSDSVAHVPGHGPNRGRVDETGGMASHGKGDPTHAAIGELSAGRHVVIPISAMRDQRRRQSRDDHRDAQHWKEWAVQGVQGNS